MNALIVNDVHIGATRQAGTTPTTASAIRDYLQASLRDLLLQHTDKHVIINGDLLDQFDIDTAQLIQVYETLLLWTAQAAPGCKMFALAGNHDRNPRGFKVSSFELLCKIMGGSAPEGTFVPLIRGELAHLYGPVWAIPHCDNQDLFNLELEKALEELADGDYLFLHCNYANHFAEHADHSLNLSEEQAKALNDKGITLVIAHEHQKRVLNKGKVYITGNQWPSSIADCLGNDAKYAHVLTDVGIQAIETWNADGSFLKVDWTEIDSIEGTPDFIRVVGSCSADSAADMISAVSKLRQRSDAFVVSNAVSIDGGGGFDELGEITFESVSKFSVLDALLEELTPEEGKVIKELMND